MSDSKRTRLSTRAVHAGESVDPVTRASAPNLVMSTTFTMAEPAGFSINAFEGEMPYIYTRWGNPTVRQLEEKLAALEGAEDGLAFASGMAATSALLLGSLRAGDHVLVSDVNYAGTAELVRQTLPRYGIEIGLADTSNLTDVEAGIRQNTRMIWIETPANPILRMTDISAVAKLAHDAGATLAVDSTFATPVATRPLELGADFVVHSLTKYIGGHGDALGGAVLGRRDALAELRNDAIVHHGGVLSPFNAWLIMRGAATLPIRMRAHSETALTVARHLESLPRVKKVLYPGLPSHPQHELAARQMSVWSGMVAFQADDGTMLARRMAAELEVVHYAVSLGHHRSLIYWIGTNDLMDSSFALTGPALERYRAFAGDGVFRLSVGLEDAEDLIEDLERVLG